jgi:hypothetical protein
MKLPVLGVRDILVRIRIRIRLMDPDPTPDPTPFFIDLKDGQEIFFFVFFSYNLPTGISSLAKKILQVFRLRSEVFFTSVILGQCKNFWPSCVFTEARAME